MNSQIQEHIKKIMAKGGFTYAQLKSERVNDEALLYLKKKLKNPDKGTFYVELHDTFGRYKRILAETKDEDEAHKLYNKFLKGDV